MSLLCTKGYADEHFPFLAQVVKKSVNIRAGANTNFERLDQLNQGDEVIVLSKTFDWYRVQLSPTAKAFIRADYLKITQNSTAVLIGDKVHIRAAADSNATSLGMITQGTIVKVIAQINGWWQIEPPAQAVGWIRSDFLSFKSQDIKSSLTKDSKKAQVQAQVKAQESIATVEVKGKLALLKVPLVDVRYELIIDGKTGYYLRSKVDLSRFNGAVVLVKGIVKSDTNFEHPLLEIKHISLLL